MREMWKKEQLEKDARKKKEKKSIKLKRGREDYEIDVEEEKKKGVILENEKRRRRRRKKSEERRGGITCVGEAASASIQAA